MRSGNPPMRKENIDASSGARTQHDKDYDTIVFAGYAPHGVAVLVVTATDKESLRDPKVR